MNSAWMIIAILIPVICGLMMIALPVRNRKFYIFICLGAVCVTAVIAWLLVLYPPSESLVIFVFVHKYSIEFEIDGLSRVFMGLISSLWPIATLYSYEYMEHEASET
ncbi:MAG: proton-conducting membrane transporter, partial [Lachnospiraceae bacterium]|nr:proton-conducting membrane transporter [Lachnospiraceae bacterium]